jgi:hypothetical protein
MNRVDKGSSGNQFWYSGNTGKEENSDRRGIGKLKNI